MTYFDSVAKSVGATQAGDSLRLFMAPGMGHCETGDGPSVFDPVAALEDWVERGTAPARIIASRLRNGKVDRTVRSVRSLKLPSTRAPGTPILPAIFLQDALVPNVKRRTVLFGVAAMVVVLPVQPSAALRHRRGSLCSSRRCSSLRARPRLAVRRPRRSRGG